MIEGLEISDATKEGKSIKVITNTGEVSDVIKDIVEAQEDMEDYIDSIDNDLSELEDEVYGADF